MSKNPWINGVSASIYIAIVVSIMNLGSKIMSQNNSFFGGVAILSLFTLSAAVMGYLFCFQPAQLYFENKKKEAVRLFLQTVGVFGGITFLIFGLLFFKVFG